MRTTMNLLGLLCMVMLLSAPAQAAKSTRLTSPHGQITVDLHTEKGQLGWTVSRNGTPVFTLKDIALVLTDQTLGGTAGARSVKQKRVSQSFSPVVPLKHATIQDEYTEAVIGFGQYSIEMRVMDNAVAYRFVTRLKGEVEVKDERFRLEPATGFTAHYQTAPDNFNTSYQEAYQHMTLTDWNAAERRMATNPLLLSGPADTQLLMGESDVDDYPHQFLTTDGSAIVPRYPKAPASWDPKGDRGQTIVEASYIAKTLGQRTFPWRFVVVTDSKGIIEQTVPVQLARRNVLDDTSWIRPGKVSWEWWNGATPYGPDVDFKAGCNYETYCYFADFASRYGIEYILLDEGWAQSNTDPFHGNENLRLTELIDYCQAKGVKLMLWLPWLTVEKHFDTLFETYEQWGITAVKIDFMDHADQWMTGFYKRVMAEAARHHIMVDWHGSFTPAGLEQEYPNLLTYEGVLGLEMMARCTPDNTVLLPFIRNAVGPADFTPGGMNNMQPERFQATRPNSGAMGTRAFQMALYVVLESGWQMLADNPTRYYQNDDCTRFIASVPTTWDETRALQAEAGKYVIVAKRKGEKWYVGGICNGEQERTFQLKLDFLSEGTHKLTAYKDGVNAGYQAMHYNKVEQTVTSASTIEVKMVKNGGWAAVIE